MVFTCLFYSSRNGARRRRVDALISLAPAVPSRCARAAAPPSVRSRSSGGCARRPPFGEVSCPSSLGPAPVTASTGFLGPKHLVAARG